MRRIWGGLLCLVMLAGCGAALGAESLLIRPARVFTADDTVVHAGWVVLVEGERIKMVGPAATVHAPDGARVIDLPDATLLPGLIDAHSHLLLHSSIVQRKNYCPRNS